MLIFGLLYFFEDWINILSFSMKSFVFQIKTVPLRADYYQSLRKF
jgi:hypothetical protein